MKLGRGSHHAERRGEAQSARPNYRIVLPRMVANATRVLGLPALPRQVKELNAAAISRFPPCIGRFFSKYLLEFAAEGRLKRWRVEGRKLSFYAPLDWHGALPPELPISQSARLLEAIREYHRHHPDTPFTPRDIAARLVPQGCSARTVASGISVLARRGRLVRLGKVSGDTIFYETSAYRALSPRQKRASLQRYTAAILDGRATPTLASAVIALVHVVEQQRLRNLAARDRFALKGRPIETAEFAAALASGLSIGPLTEKTLSAAIASATAKPRTTSKSALRCVGSIGTRHFYTVADDKPSPYVDFRIAEYQLAKLLECDELRTLRGIARAGLATSGTAVPAVVAMARLSEYAARLQWRREFLAQMPWRTLLTKDECQQHGELVARAVAVEAQMVNAVRAIGGDGIQLASYIPDIPDDGAVVATLAVEKAATIAGLTRGKSARDLSGRLARKMGAVERTVPSRVALASTGIRRGGRARVYLRRSRVLCHFLRKVGGPTWAAIGAFAEDVLGDLSEADVFSWLLMNGKDRERMIAAACLAILDSMSAREALAAFLDDERRQPQRASAAMEFAVVGLARKPLLPRATGLEFVHQDLLKLLRRDSDRRIARLAMWTLRSWKPAVTQRELLAL